MIREHQCQACGLCLTVCPNLAMRISTPYIAEAEEKLASEINKLLDSAGGNPAILILACGLGGFALPEFNEVFMKDKPKNVAVVKFPCISKIDTIHILKAFNLGVDGIITAGCADDEKSDCPFRKTMYWAGQRAKRVRHLLNEVGIEEERFVLTGLSPDEISCFGDSISGALSKCMSWEKANGKGGTFFPSDVTNNGNYSGIRTKAKVRKLADNVKSAPSSDEF